MIVTSMNKEGIGKLGGVPCRAESQISGLKGWWVAEQRLPLREESHWRRPALDPESHSPCVNSAGTITCLRSGSHRNTKPKEKNSSVVG